MPISAKMREEMDRAHKRAVDDILKRHEERPEGDWVSSEITTLVKEVLSLRQERDFWMRKTECGTCPAWEKCSDLTEEYRQSVERDSLVCDQLREEAQRGVPIEYRVGMYVGTRQKNPFPDGSFLTNPPTRRMWRQVRAKSKEEAIEIAERAVRATYDLSVYYEVTLIDVTWVKVVR